MDNERYKDKVITIPNILSFVRILLIPFFVWAYSFKNDVLLTVIILAASALTDIVDGFIARRFGMVSNVGRILDPAADKLTQIAVMAALCFRYPQMIIPLALLAVKEVANGVVGLVMMKKNRDALDSQWHGKLTTVVIYLTGIAHILWTPRVPDVASYIMIGVCIFMMILSFILYTVRNKKIIDGAAEEE